MTKKYNVYGIGNAVVDYEIKVEETFFSENKVEKGLMTLVDEQRQAELIQAVQNRITLVQGGGSAANSMVALAQLGGKAFYTCKVADDKDGHFYLDDLHEHGIDTNLLKNGLKKGITGKCLVMITPDSDRTMNTFLGITSDLSESELDYQSIENAEYIFLEGYLVASPTGRQAMRAAKEHAVKKGVKVSLSFSDPSMVKYFNAEMKDIVGDKIDLLFCNEEEALLFTGAENVLHARELLKAKADRFVITQGKNGAMIWDGDTFIDIEPYSVKSIDTTGAGDMFCGAFLYGITAGHSMASSGKLASKTSSHIVSKYGPRMDQADILKIKKEIFG